jgi:hypothetical protein
MPFDADVNGVLLRNVTMHETLQPAYGLPQRSPAGIPVWL